MSPRLMTAIGSSVAALVVAAGLAVASGAGAGDGAVLVATDGGGSGSTTTTTATATSTTTSVPPTTTTLPPRAEPALLPATANGPLDGRLIVVDPGHNGRNFAFGDITREDSLHLCNTTGATSTRGIAEVDINWAVGQELSDMLNELGAAVLLTHVDNDGFGPCADERGAFARDHQADAFISIHADGSSSGSGFHIIHPGVHPNLTDDTVVQSGVLATMLRDELVAVGGRPANYVGRRGVQQRDDLANLNTANRPSVLAEMGNLRNPFDALMLEEASSQRVIAAALARGLLRYFGAPTDAVEVSGDVDRDGWPDVLPDYSTTTTTTSTTTTTTLPPETTLAPTSTITPPTVAPDVPVDDG